MQRYGHDGVGMWQVGADAGEKFTGDMGGGGVAMELRLQKQLAQSMFVASVEAQVPPRRSFTEAVGAGGAGRVVRREEVAAVRAESGHSARHHGEAVRTELRG